MENIFGKMVNIKQDSLKMVYFMEKELNIILMEILNIKMIILMANLKEMENIFLKMEHIM